MENWKRLVAANSQAEMDKFSRFYYVLGMGHGGGQFAARVDWMAALEAWVEQGQAPQRIIATDGNGSDERAHATALRVPDVPEIHRPSQSDAGPGQ